MFSLIHRFVSLSRQTGGCVVLGVAFTTVSFLLHQLPSKSHLLSVLGSVLLLLRYVSFGSIMILRWLIAILKLLVHIHCINILLLLFKLLLSLVLSIGDLLSMIFWS